MIKAVLFDLDGTLLPIDMDDFLISYLQLLAHKMEKYLEPEVFVHELLAATEAMIKSNDYQKTNAEVFKEAFFAATGLDEKELMPVFEDFYLHEYGSLGKKYKPIPIVRKIIDLLKERGYILVLATNPLFPLIAIEQRIKWAGVDPEAFDLITTYENMHATKPNPHYYQEIMEIIKVVPEHCLMVGNDVEEDLVAKTLGMQTFLVEDHMLNRKNLPIVTDYQGKLEILLDFVSNLGGVKDFNEF